MANVGTTNVPSIDWSSGGPVAPSGQAVLAGVQQDYNVAFSASFNWNLTTPQGQLAGSTAAVVNNANQEWAWIATQVDPAYSTGRFQDAIGRISPGGTFARIPSAPTVLQLQCFGGTGVVLPAGPSSYATAVDPSGNVYQCTEAGTIPSSGSIVLPFAALVPGPVPVPESVTPYQAIPGFDSAAVVSGSVGNNVETSQQFELRRTNSLAANSIATNDAILGAVLGVSGVLDAYVVDNPTNSPATIGGVSIPANTLYVAATGGVASQVAAAIWSKKPPGIPLYSGNNTQTVSDPNPAYAPPAPTYTITWETPGSLAILFAVTIANSSQVPANAVAQIQNAIINAFYAGGAVVTGFISGTTFTVSDVSQGTLTVGQTLSGGDVVLGTTIVALGTGTGGIGTYMVSTGQTVSSTSITAGSATNNPNPPAARIGSTIYATQYAGAVAALGSWAAVKSIQVGSNNTASAVVAGYVSGTTLTVVAVTSGTLAVGQWLSGGDSAGNVADGTTIIAFGSGTGGTGTYTVSGGQTIGATFTGTGSGTNLTVTAVTGTIGIGDILAGTGVPSGTTILSQSSGTPGGAGVYVTSVSTTASSASITASVSVTAAEANQNLVTVKINQEPTLVAGGIAVTVS